MGTKVKIAITGFPCWRLATPTRRHTRVVEMTTEEVTRHEKIYQDFMLAQNELTNLAYRGPFVE